MFRNLKNKIGYKSGVSFSGPNPYIPSDAVPFSPADVAGLSMWLKVDSLSLSDGNAVSTWNDSSGNAKNATGGGGSSNPTYKTNQVNGYAAVRFDGGDYMSLAGMNASGSTIFFVISGSTALTPGNNGIITYADTGNDYDAGNNISITGGYNGSGPTGLSTAWRGVYPPTYNVTTPYVGWYSYSYRVSDAGTSDFTQTTRKTEAGAWVELEAKTNAGSLVCNPSKGTLGGRSLPNPAASYYYGDMAEIIVYTRDIGTTSTYAVESYLKTKYNLY